MMDFFFVKNVKDKVKDWHLRGLELGSLFCLSA